MYLCNIDQENPFAKINPNNTFTQLITNFDNLEETDFLVIQCRYNMTDTDEKMLVNFGKIPFTVDFDLEIM